MGTLASELRTLSARIRPRPRIYADANLPAGAVDAMRSTLRWDVLFVVEDPSLRRAPDREHFTRALDLGRTLITLDRDFLDDLRFPPSLSPGLLVCVAPDERALLRILGHIGRTYFDGGTGVDLPLRGRKVEVTVDAIDRDRRVQ